MKLLTVKKVSEITSIKEKTLYDWANRGSIPCLKINGVLRFDQKEIEAWIKNSKYEPIKISFPKPKSLNDKDFNLIIKRAIESVRS